MMRSRTTLERRPGHFPEVGGVMLMGPTALLGLAASPGAPLVRLAPLRKRPFSYVCGGETIVSAYCPYLTRHTRVYPLGSKRW